MPTLFDCACLFAPFRNLCGKTRPNGKKKILLSESEIMRLRDILNIAKQNIDSWGQNPFRSPSCNINDNLEPVFKFIEEKGGNINRKSLKKFPIGTTSLYEVIKPRLYDALTSLHEQLDEQNTIKISDDTENNKEPLANKIQVDLGPFETKLEATQKTKKRKFTPLEVGKVIMHNDRSLQQGCFNNRSAGLENQEKQNLTLADVGDELDDLDYASLVNQEKQTQNPTPSYVDDQPTQEHFPRPPNELMANPFIERKIDIDESCDAYNYKVV